MTSEHSESTQKLYPKELSSRHRSIMRMEIAGHTQQDIAKELGFNGARLSLIMNSPLYIDERDKMARDVKNEFVAAEGTKLARDTTAQTLADGSNKAAKTLVGALDAMEGGVRVSAAKDILDRTGYQKEEKIRANVLVEPSQSLIDMMERNNNAGNKPEKSGEDTESTPK